MSVGWLILVVVSVSAVLLSVLFFLMVKWCPAVTIWSFMFVFMGGMVTLGFFFLLQSKGVAIPRFIAQSIVSIPSNTLTIVGGCLIAAGLLALLLAICLRHRIAIGTKTLQLGSIFLF